MHDGTKAPQMSELCHYGNEFYISSGNIPLTFFAQNHCLLSAPACPE